MDNRHVLDRLPGASLIKLADSQGLRRRERGRMASNGYHCEVVGSLLRHDELKQAMERDERGEIDAKQLEALQEEEGIRNIALQEEAGIEVLTDGEVRRRFWFDPLTDSLSGYNPEVPAPVMFHGSGDKPEGPPPKLPAVTEKLGIRHNLPLEEYKFVSANSDRPAKATLAGMTYASVLWVPGYSDKVYPGPRGLHGRGDRADEADRRRVRRGRLRLLPARLAALHASGQRGGAGEPAQPRPRHGDLARPDDRARQPADQGVPRRHLGSPSLPRQPPLDVVGRGRIRERSPSSCSTTWNAIGSSPSTTRRGPGPSSRCGSCRRARPWSSV